MADFDSVITTALSITKPNNKTQRQELMQCAKGYTNYNRWQFPISQ